MIEVLTIVAFIFLGALFGVLISIFLDWLIDNEIGVIIALLFIAGIVIWVFVKVAGGL